MREYQPVEGSAREAGSNLEALIAAELDLSNERLEFDRTWCRVRNAEEGLVGLGTQLKIFLRRAAMRTVIDEFTVIRMRVVLLPEGGPGLELPGQGIVHRPDTRNGELAQRLVCDQTTFAIDADDLDVIAPSESAS